MLLPEHDEQGGVEVSFRPSNSFQPYEGCDDTFYGAGSTQRVFRVCHFAFSFLFLLNPKRQYEVASARGFFGMFEGCAKRGGAPSQNGTACEKPCTTAVACRAQLLSSRSGHPPATVLQLIRNCSAPSLRLVPLQLHPCTVAWSALRLRSGKGSSSEFNWCPISC